MMGEASTPASCEEADGEHDPIGMTSGTHIGRGARARVSELTSVVSPQSTSVYSYGPTGMREKAVVTQAGTTRTTESIWEGGRLAAERDSDGTLYRYTYAPDGTPLALTRGFGEGAVIHGYHTDAAGSVVAITDPSGTVVASYRYDAFGAVTSVTGSDPVAERNPLRYRAYYHDASTGLYYLPARSYDPATARFLSPDPAPPVAGDPLSLNRYTYCAGDPVNASDPSGAVLVQGSGVAPRVSSHAVALAQDGRLDDAKSVQVAYRGAAAESYAAGYGFDEAGRLAELSAGAAVRAEWARQTADYATMLGLSVSAHDLEAMRDEGLSGSGAWLAAVTLISQPSASWILAGTGAWMMVTGGLWVLGGTGLISTVAGAPAGGVAVTGGFVLILVGAGLVWAGGTAEEVQTGIDIPLCGR